MFNPNRTVIEAFVSHTASAYQHAFADASPAHIRTLETATQTAMETLLRCDCPYHDIQHTMLVTDVGQTILQGRQLAKGDLSADDWLQAVVAMLFLRFLCAAIGNFQNKTGIGVGANPCGRPLGLAQGAALTISVLICLLTAATCIVT